MKGGAGQVFASNQQLQGCLVIFPDFKIGSRGYSYYVLTVHIGIEKPIS